jgi:hypothetical protein
LPNGIPNTEEARDAIAQWVAGDDNQRDVHSALGYRSPLKFETTLRKQEALTPLRRMTHARHHTKCLDKRGALQGSKP